MDPEGLTDKLLSFGCSDAPVERGTASSSSSKQLKRPLLEATRGEEQRKDEERYVFTGIPLLATKEEEQPCHEDEDDETSSSSSGNDVETVKAYSLFLGLLVGTFIQLSSLGANYVLTQSSATTSAGQHLLSSKQIIQWSMIWSVVTSLMGVVALLMVRAIVVGVRCQDTSAKHASATLLHHVECFYAIGCLAGVCCAWTVTDLMLGLNAHLLHSITTLVIALVWCHVTRGCTNCDDEQEGRRRPVEVVDCDDNVSVSSDVSLSKALIKNNKSVPSFASFRLLCLGLGLLIGFFIQFSSLGANFVLTTTLNLPEQSVATLDKKGIFLFSLAWSVFTSTLGIIVLVLTRALYTLLSNDCDDDEDEEDEVEHKSLLYLETMFATGALVGVNVAWIGTDKILNVPVHWVHSAVITFGAVVAVLTSINCLMKKQSRRSKSSPRADGYHLVKDLDVV